MRCSKDKLYIRMGALAKKHIVKRNIANALTADSNALTNVFAKIVTIWKK